MPLALFTFKYITKNQPRTIFIFIIIIILLKHDISHKVEQNDS